MISELFFYILRLKVGQNFERNPLTHTVTHITIVYSGQGSTKVYFLVTKPPEIRETLGNLPVKLSALKLCKFNNFALGLSTDSPRALFVSCVLLVAVWR